MSVKLKAELTAALLYIAAGCHVGFIDLKGNRLYPEDGWCTDEPSCTTLFEKSGGKIFGVGIRSGFGLLAIVASGATETITSQAALIDRGILPERPHIAIQGNGGGGTLWLYACRGQAATFEIAPGIRVLYDEFVIVPPASTGRYDWKWRKDCSFERCVSTPVPGPLLALFTNRAERDTNRKEIGTILEEERKALADSGYGDGGGIIPPAAVAAPAGGSGGGGGNGPPPGWMGEIIEGRPAIEIIPNEEAMGNLALSAIARRPDIYQRGGALCTISRDNGKLSGVVRPRSLSRIVDLTKDRMRGILTDEICWYQYRMVTNENGERVRIRQFRAIPDNIPGNVLSRMEFPNVRVIESVIETPIFRPDGSVCNEPGYDEATGVLYEPRIKFPSVPEAPTPGEIRDAVEMLKEPFYDFPFQNEASRSGAIAAVLTPMARFAFRGPAPLFLIDANIRGTGKSLLADVFSQIVMGRPMARTTATDNDEEMRKRITTLVISSPMMVLLDNIDGLFGGPALDAAITGLLWQDRILGQSKDVEKPLLATWLATGNNIQVKGDMSRRVVHIRFDHPEEKPELRENFRHPNLIEWIEENRAAIVAAALTILRGYVAAGRPKMKLRGWGSFEGWTALIRNTMVWAGFEDPGATREGIDQIDPNQAAIVEFVLGFEEIARDLGGEASVSAALELVEKNERLYQNQGNERVKRYLTFRAALQQIFELRTTHDLPSVKKTARLFAKYKGLVVEGRRLVGREDRNKITHWSVNYPSRDREEGLTNAGGETLN